MPRYDYKCEENGLVLEVIHPIAKKVSDWQELCELAGTDPGETDPHAKVSRIIITPPMTSTPVGNSALKNLGFTKLVKRDDGVYENVTRTGTEKRYMKSGDPSSIPHVHKKVSD